MKIEYWIILIGVILAFAVGTYKNITYEEPESFFIFSEGTPSSLLKFAPINDSNFTVTIDCNYVDIKISFDNETIEFCEWLKLNSLGEKIK